MKRKILKIFGWMIAVVCVLFLLSLATADFWAPSVIRPLLKEQGVTFAEISREDGHYLLTEVEYVADGMAVSVDNLTIPTLWRLAAKRWFNSEDAAGVILQHVIIRQLAEAKTTTTISTEDTVLQLPQLINEVFGLWDTAFEWIDLISIMDLEYRDGEEILIDDVYLGVHQSEMMGFSLKSEDEVFSQTNLWGYGFTLYRADAQRIQLVIASHDSSTIGLGLFSKWKINNSSAAVTGRVSITSDSQEMTFSAEWGPEGYIPTQAHAETTNLILPADLYELPDYEQPMVTLKADWDGTKADINVNATAKPQKADVPPLSVVIEAHGDDQVVNVEKLIAEAWSSKIELSQPLRVELNNLADLPDAELTVDLNLSDIPEESLGGMLTGAATVDHRPGEGWPLISANFAGQSLRYDELTVQSLDFKTVLDWPTLTVETLHVSTGEGTTLTIEAVADLEAQTLTSSTISLDANGELLTALQPLTGDLGMMFEQLKLTASASGPLDAPEHEGQLTITGFQATKGVRADFNAEWAADWLELSSLSLSLKNERSGLQLTGSASLGGANREAVIETASIDVREQPELILQAPFTVRLEEGGAVRVSPMNFTSEAGGLLSLTADVDYPQKGELDFQAKDLSAVWLDLVVNEPLPFGVKLDIAEIKASWDNGPLTAAIHLDAGLLPPDQPEVEILADATLSEGKLILAVSRILQGDFTLLEAQGELPMTVTPAGEYLWQLDAQAPVDFHLEGAPDDSPIWNVLENYLEMDFIRPTFEFRATGDLNAPEGQLKVQFDALESLGEVERKLPRVENANFTVDLNPDQIALPDGVIYVAGQKLQLKASLPMGRAAWLALIDDSTLPDWKTVDASLDFTDVPLVAFEYWLPDVLRSDGDITLRATLKPGENLRGMLDIDGVRTRPLAQLGSLSDVNAEFRLDGKTLSVEQAEARVGGSPLIVTGTVVLSDEWLPLFDLKLKGDNVPLARSPGLILRGSPDITLKTDAEGITTIGGVLKLNESFFTMDIAALQQSSGGGAANGGAPMRPPFFSIDDKPLADWRMHLKLEGDRFLRVRIPAFEGVVSANFDLRGPLHNPFMFGAAELQHGIIMFPFATLRLDQGAISINQNEPDIARLNISASGRAYGYDLQMRVSGTAIEPVVTFSSTPSLEQSDIIMMVTSGQIPQHARSTESRLSGIGMYIGRSFLVDLGLIDPLDDTLSISVGEDVTTSGMDTINIRYKLNDDWDIVGAYDKYDAYYLDFEWTIYED